MVTTVVVRITTKCIHALKNKNARRKNRQFISKKKKRERFIEFILIHVLNVETLWMEEAINDSTRFENES